MKDDFRVGPWLVSPSLNSISNKNTTVRLEPKVMEVLVCLAQHAGETLLKETLFQTVWPDTFVTDDVLTHSISELRRVFEDDAHEPHFIQTIPKRGYRLVAPVNAARAAAAPTPTVAQDSIVVLPFLNMSADPENEFFTDGMTEEIINALAQIKELRVVARSSAFTFKGKHVDPRSMGEQLSVRTVLEGSVRRVDHRLRITVQLINAADGYHLWSERYDREMKDVFEIQDEIARSIAERLKVTLEGDRQQPLVKAGTTNLEAYQFYLKGRAFLYKRGPAIPRALECCRQAVTLDPEYALAWAGLADSHTALGYYGLVRPEATMPRAIESARRAVALDPSLAEAHNALAMASLMGPWDRAAAELEFLRALELNPKYVQARDWYALFYLQCSEGRLEEGVAQARMALECDPLSAYSNCILGLTCGIAGRYAEGIRACERAVELDPESFIARWCLLYDLCVSRRFEEAAAVGEAALGMSGRHSWAMWVIALVFADWGKPADADSVYAEMLARARRQYVPPATLALAASAAGIEDQAVGHAQEAFKIHDPHCHFFLTRHVALTARLYAYPRFRQIIASAGRSDWLWD